MAAKDFTAVRIQKPILKMIKKQAARNFRSIPQQIAWMCERTSGKKGV